MRMLQIRVVQLRAKSDGVTGQTFLYAIDESRSELLQTPPRAWERYRWHLEHNMGVDDDLLQEAALQLMLPPYDVSLGIPAGSNCAAALE